jgi:hypothetical protein
MPPNGRTIMSIEEKKVEGVDETTKEQASDSENKQSDVEYYKSELEKISQAEKEKAERLAKAEYKLTQQDKELRELKKSKQSQEEDDDSESDEPDVDAKLNAFKQEMVQSQLEAELAKIENSDERELTRKYYQDKLAKSGTSTSAIAEDVENARFLANKAKYKAREAEIIKAAQTSRTSSHDSGVAGDFQESSRGPVLNEFEKKLLERRGLKPEDIGKDVKSLSK